MLNIRSVELINSFNSVSTSSTLLIIINMSHYLVPMLLSITMAALLAVYVLFQNSSIQQPSLAFNNFHKQYNNNCQDQAVRYHIFLHTLGYQLRYALVII